MKVSKIVSMMLVCVMCMGLVGCGEKEVEEFTIRGGIKFGMTPDEVIAIEGEPVVNNADDGNGVLYYGDEYIEGIRTLDQVFQFNDGRLYWIHYTFDISVKELDIVKNEYDKIDGLLENKYGSPHIHDIRANTKEGSNEEIEETRWYTASIDDECIIIAHYVMYNPDNNRPISHTINYYVNDEMSFSQIMEELERDKL